MFARKHRFSFKEGLPKRTKSFPSFNLRYGKNELGKARVAAVVSKRVHKHATARNAIKRRFLAHLEERLNKNRGLDLVFYIKKKALDVANLADEVESAVDFLEEI